MTFYDWMPLMFFTFALIAGPIIVVWIWLKGIEKGIEKGIDAGVDAGIKKAFDQIEKDLKKGEKTSIS